MKTMIGVMGSVSGFDDKARELAYRLGESIARHGCAVVTGACPGLPHEAVRGAKATGGLTVGVSPGHNFAEHTIKYDSPWEGYDIIIYTGSGLMGREITGVRSSDIVVLAGGRSGTLGEFSIAYDEGKLIGVLQGTGGIADHVSMLVEVINKETGAQVVYNRDPEHLIATLVEMDVARKRADRQQIAISMNSHPIDPALTASVEGTQRAIAIMEMEVRRIQANLAEHHRRLEAYRDLTLMGAGEHGKG